VPDRQAGLRPVILSVYKFSVPPEPPFVAKCPNCGVEWELDEAERTKTEFTCGACGEAFEIEQAKIETAVGSSETGLVTWRDVIEAVIRLFAIWLGLQALMFLFLFLGELISQFSRFNWLGNCISAGGCAVIAWWLWALAPRLAGWIVSGRDLVVDCGSLTLRDLYRFAFVLVGLYFAVFAFGPSIEWICYSVSRSSSEAGLTGQQQSDYYTLFRYLATLLLGIMLVLNARNFANRLVKREELAAG